MTNPPPDHTPRHDSVPLCVDLDGTLVRSDTLWESVLRLLHRRPWGLCRPFAAYARGGRSAFKAAVVDQVMIDPAALPYHTDVVEACREARAAGRPVLLVTGANRRLAEAVAAHIGGFDDVIGSRPGSNNTGHDKADELSRRYGEKAFDYFGNSHADLKVWARSHAAWVVGGDRLKSQAAALAPVAFHAPARTAPLSRALRDALRPGMLAADAAVFLPAIVRGSFDIPRLAAAFVAVGALAAGFRVGYELTHLPQLRRSGDTARRPFVQGELPLSWGVALAAVCLVIGGLAGLFLPPQAQIALAAFALAAYLRTILCGTARAPHAAFAALLVILRLALGSAAIDR